MYKDLSLLKVIVVCTTSRIDQVEEPIEIKSLEGKKTGFFLFFIRVSFFVFMIVPY